MCGGDEVCVVEGVDCGSYLSFGEEWQLVLYFGIGGIVPVSAVSEVAFF